jgi:class 3 adenylate cyclase
MAVSDGDGAAPRDLERRLATILSADVAEYSRLMAEDEEQTLRVFRGHKEVFERLVAVHRGRVFNTAGDAILAEFGSAVEAVRCATEIQAALRTRNDQLPERRQVEFRIGVNLGDVMVQEQDLLGDGVNVAARLQSAASPGGICISGSVHDQIRNRLSLSFKPLGDMNFKNIPYAVRTFSIVEAEGLGELPSAPVGRKHGSRFRRWLAVAAALLLIAGGGAFWAYSGYQRRDAELAAVAAKKHAADEARADAKRAKAAVVPTVAAVSVPPQSAAVASEKPAAANDGVYAGPICFGAAQNAPARCFPVQATLQKGSLSGQWPGRDPSVTMHLAGDVSASGHVTIHVHGEKADGSRLAVVDFSGTLRDRTLDATGEFANGRGATLNWRKSDEARPPAAPATNGTPPPAVAANPPPPLPTATEPARPPAVAATAPAPPATDEAKTQPPAGAATTPPSALASETAETGATTQGLYAGPICFGSGPAGRRRCFQAQATLEQGRLSGQWPGRDPGVTMHLDGDVSPSGQVTIHMHSEKANGSRVATANLTGSLRDGKLDATGTFLNGRTASLNWRKN